MIADENAEVRFLGFVDCLPSCSDHYLVSPKQPCILPCMVKDLKLAVFEGFRSVSTEVTNIRISHTHAQTSSSPRRSVAQRQRLAKSTCARETPLCTHEHACQRRRQQIDKSECKIQQNRRSDEKIRKPKKCVEVGGFAPPTCEACFTNISPRTLIGPSGAERRFFRTLTHHANPTPRSRPSLIPQHQSTMFNFMKTAGLGLLMVAARSIAADVSRALFWDKISWERHVGRTQAEGPAALHRRKPKGVGCTRVVVRA